jgi:hypothetical protein
MIRLSRGQLAIRFEASSGLADAFDALRRSAIDWQHRAHSIALRIRRQ